ncbi:MAG: nitroreductase family protein [Calditrichia bacterium]
MKIETENSPTTGNFSELVRNRHSVRKFLPDTVEREKIVACIEAARLAPSAENVQPWRFVVLDEPDAIENFGASAFSGLYRFSRWAAQAPVIVAIFAELDWIANRLGKQIQGTNYYLIDIGIAGEHIVLQARELGLGSCWIGWFDAAKGARALNAPGKWKLAALLALGYPAGNQAKIKGKRSLEDILFFNGYKK